jgi:acyl-CoA synthetase (AMP-forming)/AMP-acid ligase II
VSVDPYAPAGLAYTSGTTGHPKGAIHSQHNLLLPGAVLVATRGYGPELRKGDCLPLTILNLMVLTTLLTAQAGGCCVVMDRIDPEGVAAWVRDERVTTWNGVPALLHGLATNDAVRADDLASLDEVWTGGGDCPESVRAMFAAKFGQEVLATYGLTEAPTIVSIDPRGGPHTAGASGRPLPHLAVRISGDTDADGDAADGAGEICVAAATEGPWAGRYRPMLGYWGQPAATAEVLVDGELRTGDVGVLDANGLLHVRDRRSLVIIRGGANVYPAEVERVLQEAPGVAAVAVFGVADERLGERVVAAIERSDASTVDVDAVRRHCAANLAAYKVPERLVVVDRLPRNAMGKIIRRELTELTELTGLTGPTEPS